MDYTFPIFRQDILQGREVEFKYEGSLYSIINTPTGFCFSKFNEDSVCFDNANELLEKVKLYGKAFEEIFRDNKFQLVTLY
ncbi:hypothetical protein [Brevibacillus laterosporus]|uniref:Uncharacterized protein n=1 Tax=Brevibacillus laterosporus TaxID=1465 RepID=A0A0F7EJR9_BRELA|nr:hypothetical protein [Brevibacillus laterosporus]AKF95792.1 hypothetical protein EX87_19445 [Brevibacillus laterosporus]